MFGVSAVIGAIAGAADRLAREQVKMGKKRMYNIMTGEYDEQPLTKAEAEASIKASSGHYDPPPKIGDSITAKLADLWATQTQAQAAKRQADYEHSQQYYEQFYRQQGAMMQNAANQSLVQLQGAYGPQAYGWQSLQQNGYGQYPVPSLLPADFAQAIKYQQAKNDAQSAAAETLGLAPRAPFGAHPETPEAWLRRRVREVCWKGDKAA